MNGEKKNKEKLPGGMGPIVLEKLTNIDHTCNNYKTQG